MTEWRLHWLEAEGELTPWRSRVHFELESARTAVAEIVDITRLDIILQRVPGAVIPQIGMMGTAWRKSLFSITLDPDNENFETSISGTTLRRLVIHEVHHCLRMAAFGRPLTLGDALVSEGLAGQFVRRVFDSPPELWERAVDEETLRRYFPDKTALQSDMYDYGAWFHAKGGQYPLWLGYTMGYHLAGRWLEKAGNVSGATLVNVATEEVLAGAGVNRR